MDLPPHLHVAEAQPLHEMIEEVEQAEGKKEVFHLLAPQVLKAADVCVHIFMRIGSFPRNWFSYSSRYGRQQRMDRGR